MKPPYTSRQGQFLAYINHYLTLHGRPPAEAEMMQFFQVTPPSVHQMILTLERRGLITRVPGQARSIALRLQPANRSVGWPWSPPAVSPAFREGVNVLFTGTEEIEKVHAHVFAGLADAQ